MSDPATAAFDQLRAEVALLRRAVEGLSAQQPPSPPDYAPVLAKLNRTVAALGEQVGALAETPLLALTPEIVATQLRTHTSAARAEAHGELAKALSGVGQATSLLTNAAGVIRTRDEQRRWLAYAALAGAAASLIAWLGLSGPVSRAFPANWHVPERVAAAALGQDRWAAGARLMRGADEAGWQRLRRGEDLMLRNSQTIEACARRAVRVKRSVACEVRIGE